jgi:hypothetical protein
VRRGGPAFAALCALFQVPSTATAAVLEDTRFERLPSASDAEVTPYEQAPDSLGDGRVRLAWLDFGLSGTQPPGAFVYDGTWRSTSWAWQAGMVRIVRRPVGAGLPYLCDFAEGESAWFVLSVDTPGPVRVRLTLGDPDADRGPVHVGRPDGPVASVSTQAGEFVDVAFETVPVDGRVAIHLDGRDCGSFAAAGVAVYAPAGATVTANLFPPPRDAGPSEEARELLRRTCRWLLASRPSEGCFSFNGAWYECAYPIRTLLAGGRLLDEPEFTAAAVECLDRFVAEQLEDGGWSANYFGRADCALARAAREAPGSANLADVGTATLALVAASTQVDAVRRERYLAAARRFADERVLPHQLPNGAFPNLRFAGTEHRSPYSVATGVQAANLSALFGVTRDERYRAAAEAAGRFLLTGFGKPGRYEFHPHDREGTLLLPSIRFGDLFYVLEGLVWVRRYTADAELARGIEDALEAYLWGSGGVAGSRVDEVLWKASDSWEASKQGALLFLLNEYDRAVRESVSPTRDPIRERRRRDTETWIRDFRAWLGGPKSAARIGFACDPASPKGAFALPATGFAGIGLVSSVDPGALFPE